MAYVLAASLYMDGLTAFLNKRSLSPGTGLHAYVFVNKSDVAERVATADRKD